MAGTELKRSALVVMLVGIVAVSVPMLAVAGGTTATPPSDEVFEVSDNVNAWERAVFTMRADLTNAKYTLGNADWRVRNQNGDETSLNRDPIPVYGTDENVTITFDSAKANKADDYFAGEHVQTVSVHVEETGEGDVPQTTGEAFDLLTRENLNDNASISASTPYEAPGGEFKAIERKPPSGHWFVFLVANETGKNGLVTENGEFQSIDGNVTVLGAEHVVVRKGPGSVDAPDSVTRGETASFDVDAAALDAANSGAPIEQGIIVYDDNTYVAQSMVLELDSELSRDFDTNGATLHSDIDEVNGVARADGPVGMFGFQVGDGNVTGATGIGALFDFVGEQASTDMPGLEDGSSGTVVLHASSTVVNNTNPDQKLQVETLENWSTGEYRWVYVASGENSQDVVTQSGTIKVKKKSTNTGGSDPGSDPGDSDPGGVDPGGSDPDDSDPGGSSPPTDAGDDNETETETETETESDAGDDTDTPTEEPEPASITVTDATLGASEITKGESVDVGVALANDGEQEGTKTVRVRANDDIVATEDVTVGAGEIVETSISVTFEDIGIYNVTVENTSAGMVTVNGVDSTESTPGGAEPPADGGGGLPIAAIGAGLVIAGISLAVYFFRFR